MTEKHWLGDELCFLQKRVYRHSESVPDAVSRVRHAQAVEKPSAEKTQASAVRGPRRVFPPAGGKIKSESSNSKDMRLGV